VRVFDTAEQALAFLAGIVAAREGAPVSAGKRLQRRLMTTLSGSGNHPAGVYGLRWRIDRKRAGRRIAEISPASLDLQGGGSVASVRGGLAGGTAGAGSARYPSLTKFIPSGL